MFKFNKKFLLFFFLLNTKNLLANQYVVSSYNELMNLNLSSGDTIVINGMITLESNIDKKFDGLNLTFIGIDENSGFNGANKYYGFSFSSSHNINFKNLTFENFMNTEYGGVVGYDGQDENLHFLSASNNNIIFRNNAGQFNGTLYSIKGSIQLLSENSGSISFINNYSELAGGAITVERYANLDITTNSNGQINFISNQKYHDTSSGGSIFDAGGGAIFNNESNVNLVANSGSINFIDNYVVSGQGGAIYNFDGLSFTLETNGGIINFLGNNVDKNGGAIFNNGGNFSITSNSGSINFIGNKAGDSGGAIYLFDNLSNLEETTMDIVATGGSVNFLNNSAGNLGGAIYNAEAGNTLNFTANGGNIIFSDNTDSSGYNAIYAIGDATGTTTINLNASNGNMILFNDSITGSTGNNQYQILNMNNNSSTGTININDKMSNMTINIHGGSINLGEYNGRYGNFDSSNILNFYGGNITLFNNHTDNLILTTLNGNVDLGLEIDMSNLSNSDTISKSNSFNYVSGGINISKIKLTHEIQNNLTIHMDQATNLYEFLTFNNLVIESSIFNYDITYDETTHDLNFRLIQGTAGYNQEILGVPISTFTDNYLSQLNIYNQVLDFDFNDSNTYSFYFKPFFSSEDISLKYQLNTKTNNTGGIFGIDSGVIELGFFNDIQANFGFYTGYVNSTSKYNRVKTNQNGTILGFKSNLLFNDNFFTIFATNVIFFDNEIKYNLDNNSFDSYLTSLALKSGYNFVYDISNQALLNVETSLSLMYSFIDNNEYTTQGDVIVKSNNMIKIFTISPEIKFTILPTDSTLTPYFKIAGFFNINNSNNFKVESFSLLDYMVGDYAEYTFGIEKFYIEKDLTLFSNIGCRSGSRKGLNINLGLKFNM